MITYLFLIVLSATIIWRAIRWRGLFSCEGLGLAFTALIVYSDFLGLLFPQFFLSTEGIDLAYEVEFRTFPLWCLILALLSLCFGIFCGKIISPKEYCPIDLREPSQRSNLIYLGWALTILGFGLNFYGLFAAGFRSLGEYYADMYRYQAEQDGFGFFDNGVNIGVLGLSVLAASELRVNFRFLIYVIVALICAFTISISKSGINAAIIIMAVSFYYFNPQRLRWLLHPSRVVLLIFLLLIGLGIKTQIKYGFSTGQQTVSLSRTDILESSLWSVQRRYGPFGLFRGYCYLVEALSDRPYYRLDGNVIIQQMTAWIPKAIWAGKGEHAFHARGDITTEDSLIDPFQNHAPTFAGYAYADFGMTSLLVYPFIGGVMLTLFQAWMILSSPSIAKLLAYSFFVSHMGPGFSESGFLSLSYYFVFTFVLYLALQFALSIRAVLPRQTSQVYSNPARI